MAQKTIIVFTRDGSLVDLFPCTTTRSRKEILDYVDTHLAKFFAGFHACDKCQYQDTLRCADCEKRLVSVDSIITALLKGDMCKEIDDKEYIRVINNVEIGDLNASRE